MKKEKEPGIAGALNIIPGVGYLYVGTRKTFAALLLISTALTIFSLFDPLAMEYVNESAEAEMNIWTIAGLLALPLFMAAFIVDAYQEAKRVNASLKKK